VDGEDVTVRPEMLCSATLVVPSNLGWGWRGQGVCHSIQSLGRVYRSSYLPSCPLIETLIAYISPRTPVSGCSWMPRYFMPARSATFRLAGFSVET